jgi:hypothetical protein
MRGGREQNHSQEPRGDSSDHLLNSHNIIAHTFFPNMPHFKN